MPGPRESTMVRPWGWWLRVNGCELEDREGRSWSSVRDAFWHGHLGFPAISRLKDEQELLLLRVLQCVEARWLTPVETKHDIFAGNTMMWRFYMCWLASIGLVETSGHGEALEAPLSEKGRSVLLMLEAVHDPRWDAVPLREILETASEGDRAPSEEAREAALREFERESAAMPYVFSREDVGRSPVVTLTGIGSGARLVTSRVMWSQSFGDAKARDDFFAWLAERVDRWEDWGDLAYHRGQTALTQHFLRLMSLR